MFLNKEFWKDIKSPCDNQKLEQLNVINRELEMGVVCSYRVMVLNKKEKETSNRDTGMIPEHNPECILDNSA